MTAEELMMLLLSSPVHRKWPLEGVARVLFPPIGLNQYWAIRDNGKLVGLVTWAFMSDEASQRYIETFRIEPQDWLSGNNLWFMDMIVPDGMARKVVAGLNEHFSSRGFTYARSLRSRDKSRRVHYWMNTRFQEGIAA